MTNENSLAERLALHLDARATASDEAVAAASQYADGADEVVFTDFERQTAIVCRDLAAGLRAGGVRDVCKRSDSCLDCSSDGDRGSRVATQLGDWNGYGSQLVRRRLRTGSRAGGPRSAPLFLCSPHALPAGRPIRLMTGDPVAGAHDLDERVSSAVCGVASATRSLTSVHVSASPLCRAAWPSPGPPGCATIAVRGSRWHLPASALWQPTNQSSCTRRTTPRCRPQPAALVAGGQVKHGGSTRATRRALES